jgi:hypothetical protein
MALGRRGNLHLMEGEEGTHADVKMWNSWSWVSSGYRPEEQAPLFFQLILSTHADLAFTFRWRFATGDLQVYPPYLISMKSPGLSGGTFTPQRAGLEPESSVCSVISRW